MSLQELLAHPYAAYKVLFKTLSNKLKFSLDMVLHTHLIYCVPETTIMDKIFLMRKILDLRRNNNVNVTIVSLDQEKAGWVTHLFSALWVFGFSDGFLAWVSLFYRGAECLLKMGRSQPIPVQRVIRQGCPISGQLYHLAIKPLLCRLKGISKNKQK